MIRSSKYFPFLVAICIFLISCKPDKTGSNPMNLETQDNSLHVPTITNPTTKSKISSTETPTIESTPFSTPVLESSKFEPVSPLLSIPIEELFKIVSNPFLFPGKGQDDGHQGVDFSFYTYKEFSSVENHPIHSIFPGKISSVIIDRPPYGNAVIIETDLDLISEKYVDLIQNLELEDDIRTNSNLTCPDYLAISKNFSTVEESLYVLYGHLINKPQFSLNDDIAQDQLIGNVGNTGMSGNPHLHLETRIGPAHATFTEMAHYINNATTEEMTNYCLWRVSNYFKLVDPMFLFGNSHTKP